MLQESCALAPIVQKTEESVRSGWPGMSLDKRCPLWKVCNGYSNTRMMRDGSVRTTAEYNCPTTSSEQEYVRSQE